MHRFTHEAMATTFELVVAAPDDPDYARSAATAVFADIDRLEAEFVRFPVDVLTIEVPNQRVRRAARRLQCK